MQTQYNKITIIVPAAPIKVNSDSVGALLGLFRETSHFTFLLSFVMASKVFARFLVIVDTKIFSY